MKINLEEIQKRIEAGLIRTEKHPLLDFHIYNYTKKTQYNNIWDEYTKMCRGLILDSEGNIISRPFPKFFNLNEVPETMFQSLPNELPAFLDKLDGSLGISYPDSNNLSIATRGGFTYDQALWATDWLHQKEYSVDDFKPYYTYCFEIVYPVSKNIVNYNDRSELVLLAVINNADGSEFDYVKEAEELELSYAQQYQFDRIDDAIHWLSHYKGSEKEGFVCRYSNGLRVKIKSDDYRRLHKILTGLSERDIWETLKSGESLDSILEIAPDEFYQWIKSTEQNLNKSKNHIISRGIAFSKEALKLHTRKEQALYINDHAPDISTVVFNLLDDNIDEAEEAAWRMIKPSGEVFKKTRCK